MSKGKACAPSLIEPVVMVTGTEIADRPLRVRSGNYAREKDFTFVFIPRSLHQYNYIMPAIDDQSILLGTTGRDIGI